MRTKYKAWANPFLQEHEKEISFDINSAYSYNNIVLEIGSGKGLFLLEMAKKFPNIMFVGVEKNVTCAGFCAKKIVENNIQNAKIIYKDIEKIFDLIKENSFSSIFLNFSDPWPKKRHEKRRLTFPKFLLNYYKILRNDGYLYFKSDNEDLYLYSLETIYNSPFKVISYSDDYQTNDNFDTMTEYEISFRNKGTKIKRIVAQKHD